MARSKGYDYTQTVLIPVALENQLLPGTLAFAIQELVDRRLETSIFGGRYKNDETGCPAYDPKLGLKVILFAYSRGIISWRKIEQACRENITFMALACGRVPDHSAIATFVSSMKEEISALCRASRQVQSAARPRNRASGFRGGRCRGRVLWGGSPLSGRAKQTAPHVGLLSG